jgi:hypothetical protein
VPIPRILGRAAAAILPLPVLLAACGWQGPGLAGYPGLQWQVVSFYDGRAMEAAARCPNPRLVGFTRAEVVEDTPERVVMDLRYRWVDDTRTVDSGGSGGSSKITCQDWGTRRFTFARASDGQLQVASMTGPQRR